MYATRTTGKRQKQTDDKRATFKREPIHVVLRTFFSPFFLPETYIHSQSPVCPPPFVIYIIVRSLATPIDTPLNGGTVLTRDTVPPAPVRRTRDVDLKSSLPPRFPPLPAPIRRLRRALRQFRQQLLLIAPVRRRHAPPWSFSPSFVGGKSRNDFDVLKTLLTPQTRDFPKSSESQTLIRTSDVHTCYTWPYIVRHEGGLILK